MLRFYKRDNKGNSNSYPISIHLMLRFYVKDLTDYFGRTIHFNTSHVKVLQEHVRGVNTTEINFNTSHVKVLPGSPSSS